MPEFDVLPAADEITQPFGCTDVPQEWIAPWCPSDRFHSGIDLGSTRGGAAIFRAPVFATRPGRVVAIGEPYLGDQAVCLRLDDGSGWVWYGHLDAALVLLNEHVVPHQDVGLVGTRGSSTAPHLHLEHRIDGIPRNVDHQAAGLVNPEPLLYALAVAGTPAVPDTAGWSWKTEPLGGKWKALTAPLLWPDGSIHLFGIGEDDQLWHVRWSPA